MNGNMRLLGVVLLVVSMVGCGDTEAIDNGTGVISCTTSSECGDATVCSNGLCIPKCGPETPCAAGEFCNGAGICVPNESNTLPGPSDCTPSCVETGGCGPDGCGGDCGSCDAGQLCAKNSCVAEADCTMTCETESAACGNICGDSCGACTDAEVCSTDLLCVPAPGGSDNCTDTCSSTGAVCGEVCGTSCGTCAEGETCTSGSCGAGVEDCVADGCPVGQTCDEETGSCGEAPSGSGDSCQTCSSDDDCSGGWSCIALSSGKVCLKPCNTNDLCDTGWSCVGNPAVCTPDVSYSCAGCVSDGCPDGKTCDPGSGACQAEKGSCDSCTDNWQCGSSAACIDEANGGSVCKPRCSAGADTCAESATCGLDAASELNVCAYQSESCCYDSEAVCGAGVTCEGATPHLLDGQCVQCTTDEHCSGGICNTNTNVCESEECTGDTPFLFEEECVECLTNGDCSSGSCNTDSHECVAASDECGQCNDDYPVCLELQGDTYCVQCTDDTHCDAGCTCDTQLYACSGDCVVAGSEQCGGDTGETCPNGLVCQNSLCVDPTGACDGVTVMCPGGNQCVSLLELLMGGGGGGALPIPPGMGGGIPGICGCTPGANDCASGIPCTEMTGGGGACVDCGPLAMLNGGIEKVLMCAFLGM
jgi:hypothetical protein